MVANIGPSSSNLAETLSTLRFAQRAKSIKNKAVVNEDTLGDVSSLQAEIARLKDELASARTLSMVCSQLQSLHRRLQVLRVQQQCVRVDHTPSEGDSIDVQLFLSLSAILKWTTSSDHHASNE